MLNYYCNSLGQYSRLQTREVKIGDLILGNMHPIRVQTMTTTNTMDTKATAAQIIRCVAAGAELVRVATPSQNEAENLRNIKAELKQQGYGNMPLVADIHFTPNAAEIAARYVEKVRINPGNYAEKKKVATADYSDSEYQEELARIEKKLRVLLKICKENGTALRIGTNHGSLSDRILSRYGDTPMGMVESAMEFLRIARNEAFHNIVLSMKSSNPKVMVQAYRLLVHKMDEEFEHECYPLHLGVTEAGDGVDGRIKSAVGIGTMLEDGIGDTIRVSLTEDPENEIPVCKLLIKKYNTQPKIAKETQKLPYDPFNYTRRITNAVGNIGGSNVPVVIASSGFKFEDGPNATASDKNMHAQGALGANTIIVNTIDISFLKSIGYCYDEQNDKWSIKDNAADYLYIHDGSAELPDKFPPTLKIITLFRGYKESKEKWKETHPTNEHFPLFGNISDYIANQDQRNEKMNFVQIHTDSHCEFNLSERDGTEPIKIESIKNDPTIVLVATMSSKYDCNVTLQTIRNLFIECVEMDIKCPIVMLFSIQKNEAEKWMLQMATTTGALLLDGFIDGIFIFSKQNACMVPFANETAFNILQATGTRISKTEYISCPSCGRTLFDLQETTQKIKAVTGHLKGLKIAIMGCIVNGPGEMADADFGYVGSGAGKITLYKGKEIMKKNVDSSVAVEELVALLKANNAWVAP